MSPVAVAESVERASPAHAHARVQEGGRASSSSVRASHGDDDESAWNATANTEELMCKYCGALLGDDHEDDLSDTEEDEPAPKPSPPEKAIKTKPTAPSKKQKPRTSPRALRLDTVRLKIRISMLAAIPSVTPNAAAAILRKYPTFATIVCAGVTKLANVQSGKHTHVGKVRAWAVLKALEE